MTRATTRRQSQRAKDSSVPRGIARRLTWIVGGVLVLLGVAAVLWFIGRQASSRGEPTGAIATLQTLDQHALVFSPTDPNVVLFGHHNGVMRSDDGGHTWKPLVDRRGFDAMQLATVGRPNGKIYLAGHDVFQVSDDGGASWRPVQNNLPGTDIHQFALNPDDPLKLTAVVVGFGAYRSTDGGQTWTRLPVQPPGDVTALASAGGNPETLYAGTAHSGVLRSADERRAWVSDSGQASNDAAFVTVLALAVDPSARQRLYVGTESGLARSDDAGATWAALPYPGDNALAVAVSPANPNIVLAVATTPRHQGLV